MAKHSTVITISVLGLVASTVFAGCARSQNTKSPETKAPSPAQIAQAHVNRGLRYAVSRVENLDYYTFEGRTNPVSHCGAPPHELFIRGRWQRVKLSGPDQILQNLKSQLADQSAKLRSYDFKVVGYPDGKLRVFGQLYPEIVVQKLLEVK